MDFQVEIPYAWKGAVNMFCDGGRDAVDLELAQTRCLGCDDHLEIKWSWF